MRAKLLTSFIFISLITINLSLLTSCSGKKDKFVIGVSQCSEDSWRNKLQQELQTATYYYDNVELQFAQARDDDKLQIQQINDMVEQGVDLIIVSPNSMGELTGAIDKAYDAGIPVILFDRKTGSDKYSAFMGADNFLIGQTMGELIAHNMHEEGSIVVIGGLDQSSPAKERNRGFHSAIEKYPGIEVVGVGTGDWTESSGKEQMQKILTTYTGRIDCVFGGNDRMAIGARKAMEEAGRLGNTSFYGIDALSGEGEGLQLVRDGKLAASAIYPTHGDELLELAIKILCGDDFEREHSMNSAVVTPENVKIFLMQSEVTERQSENLINLCGRIDNSLVVLQNQRLLLFCLIGILIILVIGIVAIYKLNLQLHHEKKVVESQRDEIRSQRDDLAVQKETVERQRDELERQRDELIEASMHEKATIKEIEQTPKEPADPFLRRFNECLEKHLSDSDLSVETIGQEIGYSRVQLYRKVKALTGHSPVDLLRQVRLERAARLLKEGNLNVSEVGYRVGFSSPSYFNKCFKDQYGISPGEVQKKWAN